VVFGKIVKERVFLFLIPFGSALILLKEPVVASVEAGAAV
jgi:hypothetical protein